jgi:putative inorganic carbon (hco3(-)) transporter
MMGAAPDRAASAPGPAERTARLLLLLFIALLGIMQPPIRLIGFAAVPGDFLFVPLAAGWAVLLAARKAPLVLDRGYWFIGFYFAAMLASALTAASPSQAASKLATQIYLLSLPILVCSLLRDEAALRAALRWWLAGTALVVAIGAGSLLLFAIDPEHPLLRYTRFHFGTLPAGDYPRLRLTFLNANMACNYLTVSLGLLLVAGRKQWIGKRAFLLLLGGILLSAAATISPGLGGVFLMLGLWVWLTQRRQRPGTGRLALASGTAAALLFIPAMAFTPILHRTAPFLIHVPIFDLTLAPAGRLMIWMDAVRNALADPLLGRGIGADAVLVRYQDPSGNLQRLTDAHNMFLSIAVQCGLVGLTALLALIAYAVRRTAPFRLLDGNTNLVRLGVGLAFLDGFVYQGLGGSFEDARHLWVVFGLLLAAGRVEGRARAGV